MRRKNGWHGFDLDGTIATSLGARFTVDAIGDPVPSMVARICALLDAGEEVRIVTARVGPSHPQEERDIAERAIRAWTLRHIGCELPVTASKDANMTVLYDDRAVRVERDTGRILSLDVEPTNGRVSCTHCDGTGVTPMPGFVHVAERYGMPLCGAVIDRYDSWIPLTSIAHHLEVTCPSCSTLCDCVQCVFRRDTCK